ncbi:SlyX family protein [uncultured Sphaerochaeta sp.]|uniref:SlyX family protein n=1 Tax=uncultured Sphaerochaeta sp. TaxID=886478 RepID=UPI002A0A2C1C|nr:SlyX family protein [uncultured Sphaerochaeta sp.]
MIEERLDALEMKFSYSEETVETLNRIVTEQAKEIALLESHLEKLEKKVSDLMEETGDGLRPSRRPPHY